VMGLLEEELSPVSPLPIGSAILLSSGVGQGGIAVTLLFLPLLPRQRTG